MCSMAAERTGREISTTAVTNIAKKQRKAGHADVTKDMVTGPTGVGI